MKIYFLLFRQNDHKVSNTGYFVYCNGNTDKEAFDSKLEFDIKIIPYKGDTSWVEQTIMDAIKCLKSDKLPESSEDCDFCKYREAAKNAESSMDRDELFAQAVEFVKDLDQVTASGLQKKFDTGYARSARILDELELAGIIGSGEGAKPRKVLIKKS